MQFHIDFGPIVRQFQNNQDVQWKQIFLCGTQYVNNFITSQKKKSPNILHNLVGIVYVSSWKKGIDKEENIVKVSKSNQDVHWKQKYLKSTTCKNIGPDVHTFLWPHKGAPS